MKKTGNSCIVCGLGGSIEGFLPPEGYSIFGVNDVDRWIKPDYLLVVNPAGSFRGDRWQWIKETRAEWVFTHLDLPIDDRSKIVPISLGVEGGFNLDGTRCDYTNNSPYMAVILAYKMGYRKIYLIGVDLVDHPKLKNQQQIARQYERLGQELVKNGCEIGNLSKNSIVPWDFVDLSLLGPNRSY